MITTGGEGHFYWTDKNTTDYNYNGQGKRFL